MIFGDYVSGFLGLARDGSGWSMNPFDVCGLLYSFFRRKLTVAFIFQPIKMEDGQFLGRGEGNHCSVEFNLLYRVSTLIIYPMRVVDILVSSSVSGMRRRHRMTLPGRRT